MALALLLVWDMSGLDQWVAHAVAGPHGFPWRDAWVTRHLLHDGGRWLSGAVFAGLAWRAWRAGRQQAVHAAHAGRLRAGARWWALGIVLLNLVVVPTFKRFSDTSCPWELAEFGGTAQWVSHWAWGVLDGGSGHCFPSGHAVAAFAFFPMALAWRRVRPKVARRWFWGVMLAGGLFGAAQVLRGAHFVSHVAWAAWICWVLSVGADALSRRRRRTPAVAPATVGSPG